MSEREKEHMINEYAMSGISGITEIWRMTSTGGLPPVTAGRRMERVRETLQQLDKAIGEAVEELERDL